MLFSLRPTSKFQHIPHYSAESRTDAVKNMRGIGVFVRFRELSSFRNTETRALHLPAKIGLFSRDFVCAQSVREPIFAHGVSFHARAVEKIYEAGPSSSCGLCGSRWKRKFFILSLFQHIFEKSISSIKIFLLF